MAMMEHKLKEGAVDVINFILAVFLFLTPWIFGFMSEHTAAGNAWVIGVVMGIVAIVALTKFAEWEEWVNLLLGVWVVVSPWVLGFVVTTAATWVHVIVGLIVAILAAVKLWQLRQPPHLTAHR